MGAKTIGLVVAITAIAFMTVEVGLLLQGQIGTPVSTGHDDPRSEIDAKVLTYAFRTNVSGIITVDTTWTEANSPYVVIGSVLVSSGVTLTIEPGVIVKLESAKGLQIDGKLVARGSDAKPIVITSIRDDSFGGDTNGDGNLTLPAPGDWNELLLTDLSVDAVCDSEGNYIDGSVIEHVVFLYGGGQPDSGIIATLHTILSSHLIVRSSVMYSRGDGIHIANGCITMIGCDISRNGQYQVNYPYGNGIAAVSDSSFTSDLFFNIRNCTVALNFASGISLSPYYTATGIVSGNSVSENGARGLFITSMSMATSLEVSNNTFSANHQSGATFSYGNYKITDNLVSYNLGGGIEILCSNAVVRNNLIMHNSDSAGRGFAGINAWSYMMSSVSQEIANNILTENEGSPVMQLYMWKGYYGGESLTVHDNTIVRNRGCAASLYEESGAEVVFAHNLVTQNFNPTSSCESVVAQGLPAVCYNNLFGNEYETELANANEAGGAHLDATSNWWGTNDDSQVQQRIYDWNDDSSKGIVDYSPFSPSIRTDAPISPPTNLAWSYDGEVVTASWSPNPEADVAGYKIYYDSDSGYPLEHSIDVGATTTHALTEISAEDGWFIAVTAYDSEADGSNDICEGHESWFSNETVIDVVPPTGSITINNGDEYGYGSGGWSNYLSLALDAEDKTSGVADMRFSEDGLNWNDWQVYSNTLSYYLAGDIEGVRTIYVQFRDHIGMVSPSYSDSITMDFGNPTGGIIINGGAHYTSSVSVALTLSASDTVSGVASMRFANYGGDWTDWEDYSTSKPWNLTPGDGQKQIYVCLTDRVGHASAVYTASIILDTTPPTAYPLFGTTYNTVHLDGFNSTDANGITGWNWTFTYQGSKVTLEGCYEDFTFNVPGDYDITLNVTDHANLWAVKTFTVTIPASAIDTISPVADAGIDLHAIVGASVYFNGTNSTDNVGIVSYEWAFGDGATGSGITVRHSYLNPGTYVVVLTVKDSHNNTATDTISVTVTSPEQSPAQPQNDGSWNLPIWMIAAACAGVVVALTTLVLIRRRHA